MKRTENQIVTTSSKVCHKKRNQPGNIGLVFRVRSLARKIKNAAVRFQHGSGRMFFLPWYQIFLPCAYLPSMCYSKCNEFGWCTNFGLFCSHFPAVFCNGCAEIKTIKLLNSMEGNDGNSSEQELGLDHSMSSKRLQSNSSLLRLTRGLL